MNRVLTLMTLACASACGGATSAEKVDLGNPDKMQQGPAAGAVPSDDGVKPAVVEAPKPEAVVTGQTLPTGLAVGGGFVFFTAASGSSDPLWRIDLTHRTVTPVGIYPAQRDASIVAADDKGFFTAVDTHVLGSAVDGCVVYECDSFVPMFDAQIASGPISAIGLSQKYVYALAIQGFDTAVYRAARTLTSDRYEHAATVDAELIAVLPETRAMSVAVAGDSVFVGGDTVLYEISESKPQPRVAAYAGPQGKFAANATHLYWFDGRGLVRRAHVAGAAEVVFPYESVGAQVSFGALGTKAAYTFVDQGKHAQGSGRLLRIDLDTFAATEIARDLSGQNQATFAAGYVYWSSPRAGTIQRLIE